jgi:hypothetical protein
MNKILLLIALLLPAVAFANDYEDIVKRAFESIDRDFKEHWAFTETSTKDDVVLIGRYDPRLPENDRWALVSVDGLEPQEDEIEDYLEEKEKDNRRGRRGGPPDGDDANDANDEGAEHDEDEREYSAIVNFTSLELVEETSDHWIFDFKPRIDADDDSDAKFMRDVIGRLKIIKNGHYIATINMHNKKTIKPAVGVKISKFITTMTFGPATDEGPIVPIAVDVEVKGRAMLVIRFDEVENVRFSDFEFAGS